MLAVWLLAGRGGSGDSGEDIPGETAQYLPLAVGNVWEYTFTEYTPPSGIKSARPSARRSRPVVGTKQLTGTDTVTVTGITRIEGQDWHSVVYQYTGGDPEPAIYVRHIKAGLQNLDPALGQPVFDIKLPMQVGTTWTKRWLYDAEDEVPQTSQMTITSLTAEVATPAGVFTNCLQVEDVWLESSKPDIITRWYAPGVGQVREEHHVDTFLEDQVELTSFTLAAAGL